MTYQTPLAIICWTLAILITFFATMFCAFILFAAISSIRAKFRNGKIKKVDPKGNLN